jgi:hypothetical protein
MNNVRDGYTKRGHEWLLLLSKGPTVADGFGNAACRCRRNGWCDWLLGANGRIDREVITEAGRAKLAEWNRMHPEVAP